MRTSISSSPSLSISIMARASMAVLPSMMPLPRTCEKSRTQRRRLLAMRGVPRERAAISLAPSGRISISRSAAEREMMTASSSRE